jgi:DeoR/GlpR family transcriptional regulator of sugar metabolism
MHKEKRQARILEMLQRDDVVTIKQLSGALQTSYMTIWRDLAEMEAKGLLQRVRGGAINRSHSMKNPIMMSWLDRLHSEPRYGAKQQIGRYAARYLVDAGDSITIEAGSTTTSMATYLDAAELTVLTNGLLASLLVFQADARINLLCSGGVLIETGAFIGPQAEEFFSHFRVRKAFLGAQGLSLQDGFTDQTPLYTRLKNVIMQNCEKVVVLIDSSKIGMRALVPVISLENVHSVVTDRGAPIEILDGLRQRGINVHVAGEDNESPKKT